MELSATAFFSSRMPAVLTDSAISSIIHVPPQSANLLIADWALDADILRESNIQVVRARVLSFCPRCVTIFVAFPCSALGGTTPEEYQFMSRSTLMALAISCVLSCASYAQEPAAKQQPTSPPAPTASSQSPAAAPAPAAPPAPAA